MSDYIRGKKLTDIESELLNILEELRALDRVEKFNDCIEPLKPCPCCGSNAYYCEDMRHNYYVNCGGCGLKTRPDDSKEAVKRMWNRRV